jgi:hypothetical protein
MESVVSIVRRMVEGVGTFCLVIIVSSILEGCTCYGFMTKS